MIQDDKLLVAYNLMKIRRKQINMVRVNEDTSREVLSDKLGEKGIDQITALSPELFESIEKTERDRGVLTPSDREFLLGKKDYNHAQAESNKKRDIRERTRNAIIDFELLFWFLEEEQSKAVFDSLDEDDIVPRLGYVIGYLYQALGLEEDELSRCIEESITLGEYWSGPAGKSENGQLRDVSVSIDVEYDPATDHLKQKLEEGKFLTDREIGLLVRSGDLSAQEMKNLRVDQADET